MLVVNGRISIPDGEFDWSFARSGGPGGQNVNKVESKAVLRWPVAASPSIPEPVRARFLARHRRRVTAEGVFVMQSQRYRDQDRNKQDCLEKLAELLREAAVVPKARVATKPTRGSKERRLTEKKRRGAVKRDRRGSEE